MVTDEQREAEQKAAQEAQAKKEKANQAANQQKSNAIQNQLNQQAINEQQLANANAQSTHNQQTSPKPQEVPQWMKQGAEVAIKFERSGPEDKNNILNSLKMLISNKLIKGYEETKNGFKAILEGGNHFEMDLKNNVITLSSLGQKTFDAVAMLVASARGTGLDISQLPDEASRFAAFKAAKDHNLAVNGLKPEEQAKFSNQLNDKNLMPKI